MTTMERLLLTILAFYCLLSLQKIGAVVEVLGEEGATDKECAIEGSCVAPPTAEYDDDEEPAASGGTYDVTSGSKDSSNNKFNENRDSDDLAWPHPVPDSCKLVLAKTSAYSESGWGVFALEPQQRGTPVVSGDVVIQVNDAPESFHLLNLFAWEGQETGGMFEGEKSVASVIPGIGMLAATSETSNVLPFVPRFDEGGLTRNDSPGAGAITHYHNYTWFYSTDVQAGEELLVKANSPWFDTEKSRAKSRSDGPSIAREKTTIKWLRQNGYCLDNMKSAMSTLKNVGRGAIALRSISQGDIIAPVPVIPIPSEKLEIIRPKKKGRPSVKQQQLLRNYCFGNENSTMVLFPFSPIVNLINHYPEHNARLQWSPQTDESVFSLTTEQVLSSKAALMLELVATKDIKESDEIFIDYGRKWEHEWWKHVKLEWKPLTAHYVPGTVVDDASRSLRTEAEQKDHPYDANVMTTCFYRYSDRTPEERMLTTSAKMHEVTSYRWNMTKGIYNMRYLRPCTILRRAEDSKGRTGYSVRVGNRPGLSEEERIPKGQLHIVTHVPRKAMRFSDKPYTTDQHLEQAFRHEIILGADLFPSAWMDKSESAK